MCNFKTFVFSYAEDVNIIFFDLADLYLETTYSNMPEEFHGQWIKPDNEKEVDSTTKEENSKKGRRKKKIVG